MRPLSLAFTAFAVAATPVGAQTLKGDFSGSIESAPGHQMHFLLHLSDALEGGGLVGTMDNLDQGAKGLGIGGITTSNGKLHYAAPAIHAGYDGQWDDAKGVWTGTWTQGSNSFPLTWTPTDARPRPPLVAPAHWSMPDPDSALAPLVAGKPGILIAAATVDAGHVRTAIGGEVGDVAATRFEIGSVTKLFTDLLLADMVVRGEVKLDDPVRDYLPQGTLADHGYRPITLRDLASHYSGMPRYPRHMADAQRSDPFAGYDEVHLYAFLSGWTPMRSPGAMFEYSNLGAAVLGDALARRAGKPYEELLTERVLSPLGLQHTNFTDEGLAVPHDAKGNAVNPWHLGTLNPAGGLRSTVGDMARFSAALLDPPAKLRPAVDLMMDQKLRPAGGFSEVGLGLLTVPTTAGVLLSHDGGTGGMRSSLYLDRKRKRAVVVLTNTAGDPNARELGVSLIAGAAPPASADGQP